METAISEVISTYPCFNGSAQTVGSQNTTGNAIVDVAARTGQAQFLGSNFIYGFPDNGVEAQNAIPDHFLTGIKFNACRAGGAQIAARGWGSGGYAEYIGRFNSTLSNYRSTRKYNGEFILLLHDLVPKIPGSVKNDIEANDMLEGLIIDIWNEPELDIFWKRSWEQYLDYYVHATGLVSTYWNSWASVVAGNRTLPDIYSWHQIGIWEREPDRSVAEFTALLDLYGLPEKPIDLNEYAWTTEQNPANSAFYLAQLERLNVRGLRANWGSGAGLHDYLANLVFQSESDGEYHPNGEWHLYNYYANMTGDRVATTAAADRQSDVFATTSRGEVIILAGTRSVQAAYGVTVRGLPNLGYPRRGEIGVRILRFDWNGQFAEAGGR